MNSLYIAVLFAKLVLASRVLSYEPLREYAGKDFFSRWDIDGASSLLNLRRAPTDTFVLQEAAPPSHNIPAHNTTLPLSTIQMGTLLSVSTIAPKSILFIPTLDL
jgi:hypothetical protein